MTDHDPDDRRSVLGSKHTRRGVLAGLATSGVVGMAIAAESNDDTLVGGNMIDNAQQVSDRLYMGPESAVTGSEPDVAPEVGRLYKAVDTDVEYYGDGDSWQLMGHGSEQTKVPEGYYESFHTEKASTKQLNDNIYPASEYATSGSGTDSDPYTDGIQAAFNQAAADGRRIVRVELDGEFDLSSQVNPPAFYSWEVVGTGNFNFIKGPGTEPAFLVNNEVHSPRFHNFRARNRGGQNPWVKFDVEGIGNFVEPWFSWIEFDRNWRAIEIEQGSTTNAGLMELQNCWFHYGLSGETGDYYIKQTSTGAEFGGISAKGCRFWLDGGETSDGFQGGIDLENAFLEIELRDCRAVDAGSGAWLKATNADSTKNQPDVEIKDNYIKCATTDTADHAERLFVFNNGGYINISGNTVRGTVDKALGFVTITDALRFEIDDNPVSPNVFSGAALNIDNSAIGEINQVGYSGVAGSRAFNTWYRNDDPSDKEIKVTVQSSADATTVNAILDISPNQSNEVTDQVRRVLDSNETDTLGGTVPANHDYQVRAFGDTGTYDILAWREK